MNGLNPRADLQCVHVVSHGLSQGLRAEERKNGDALTDSTIKQENLVGGGLPFDFEKRGQPGGEGQHFFLPLLDAEILGKTECDRWRHEVDV